MASFGIFHNGSTSASMRRTEDGRVIPDASLSDIHEEKKNAVTDQIESAVLAEDLGFDRVFFTEHHFQPTGSEFSPNPLQAQMAVAAQTDEIRLGQLANIITYHDPVRFAEMAAALDVASDGRAEIGVGRGYQPRESEVLGQYWGGTVQDQEKNRRSFNEKLELITKCWTEDSFSHLGEYHSIPPKHTKWHHDLEHAYFSSDVTEQEVDDVMDWQDSGDFYSDLWNRVMSMGTTLKQISVFPQPQQQPHPPLWMPATSLRSIETAAENGINAAFLGAPTDDFKKLTGAYFQKVDESGWPDHRPEYDGEPFEYGWDEERQRGVVAMRPVWNTDVATEEETDRCLMGLENAWNFFRPLLNIGGIFDVDSPEDWITQEMILDSEFMHVGSTEEIIDELSYFKNEVGYEDFAFICAFETPGVGPEAEHRQMEAFSEEVMPYFEEESA